ATTPMARCDNVRADGRSSRLGPVVAHSRRAPASNRPAVQKYISCCPLRCRWPDGWITIPNTSWLTAGATKASEIASDDEAPQTEYRMYAMEATRQATTTLVVSRGSRSDVARSRN